MKISQARVAEIKEALLAHLAVEKKCPAALDDLIRDRAVDRHSLNDAWGTPIAYRCSDRGTQVRSAGPNKVFGTADDITSKTILPAGGAH
jgi:hypothetical protein